MEARRFKLVVPNDPFGKTNRYRQVRLMLETRGVFRPLFWFSRAADHSLSFGLSSSRPAEKLGHARLADGKLVPIEESSVGSLPIERRECLHVTLHPSGTCHIRAQSVEPLSRHGLPNWYPVQEPFTWLYAVSDPVETLPTGMPRKRDALTTFPKPEKSARVRIDVLPASPDGHYDYVINTVETLVGLGPQFVVRITVAEHDPIGMMIAVAESVPVRLDPF